MSRHHLGALCALAVALTVIAAFAPPAAAWTPAVQISEGSDPSWASDGAAAGSGASLYVVYLAPTDTEDRAVRLRQSEDGGATFLPSIILSGAPTSANQPPSVAAAGSSVYGVWVVGSGASERVWLRRSTDAGATWADSVALTPPGMTLGITGVFASGERVFVTYTDLVTHRLLLRRSTNRGATFAAPVDMGASPHGGRATMAFSTGVVYIAWAGTNGKIRLRRSTTGGVTWNASVAMQTPADGGSYSTEPWLAATGDKAMLVGRSAYLIFSWASADDGRHWGSARHVSGSSHPLAVDPMLIRVPGRWIVTYRACTDDGPNGCEVTPIYLRTSLDGRQWTTARSMSGAGPAYNAGLTRTSSNGLTWVVFAWESWEMAGELKVYAKSR